MNVDNNEGLLSKRLRQIDVVDCSSDRKPGVQNYLRTAMNIPSPLYRPKELLVMPYRDVSHKHKGYRFDEMAVVMHNTAVFTIF